MATAPTFERKTFPEGAVLFQEGDAPDGVYLVESGLVEILVRRVDGTHAVIGSVGPGEVLGEMALIDNKPRMATARVALDAQVMLIPPEAFRAHLKAVPPVMARVMTQLTRRLRAMACDVSLGRSSP